MPFIDLQSVAVKMEFKTQFPKLLVANFDKFIQEWKIEVKRHGNLSPNSVRAIFCGPSNTGANSKTLINEIGYRNSRTDVK